MSSIRFQISRLCVSATLFVLGSGAAASYGQTQSLAIPRVLDVVNASQTVPLKDGAFPLAQSRFDRGRVADNVPTGHMMVMLRRSDSQEQALREMLAAQQDPKSASFHKWMTPESFGAQFGVADADLQAVSSYLSSQGFAVGRVFKSKMAIEFSGTTGQIRSSFKTEIHNYVVNGQAFRANATAPQIPAALAPVVRGFAAMTNYKTPQKPMTQQMVLDRKTGRSRPLYADPLSVPLQSVSPGDLAVIYDIPTARYDGTGVTVGIISDSNINVAIPANYRTTFGLPANPPTVVVDGEDPGITSANEANLDRAYAEIELVAATAPAAKVNLYTSATTQLDSGFDFAAIRALEDNSVQVLISGFEACEAALGGENGLINAIWEQAAAQGISVISGSGSGGSAACDAVSNGGDSETQASQGLAVNGYASTPYDTAVGTSDFYYGPTGTVTDGNPGPFYNYWSTTNSGTAGYTSAKQYIPEQPNNQSNTATNQQVFGFAVFASGGGISTVGKTNDDGTQTPYLRPTYQMAAANKAGIGGNSRLVPDVSIFGAFNNGSVYISCVFAYDCVNGSPDSLQYTAATGPSVAAAAFGGIAALVVQAKGPQGNLNPALYATYAAAPSAFHDITAGTNTVACVAGSPNCGGTYLQAASGGDAYQAVGGYDLASGLGSVDVANLINNWTTPTGAATVTVAVTPGSFHHGEAASLKVIVTGAGGTPTGDIAITTSSPQNRTLETLTLAADGTASDNDFGRLVVGGTNRIIARYAGDITYAPAVGSVQVTVNQIASRMVLLASGPLNEPLTVYNGQTVPYGTPIQFSLQVSSATDPNDRGTPSGAIVLYDNGNQFATIQINSEGYATFRSNNIPSGSHSFSATYAGDNTYGSTSLPGAGPRFVIAGAPTATNLSASDTNLASRNSTFQLLATVTPTAGTTQNPVYGAAPGGTIRFTTSGGTQLGTAPLSLGANAGTSPASSASFTVARQALPAGTTSIIATYLPDGTGAYTTSASAPVAIAVTAGRGYTNTNLRLAVTPAGAVNFLNSGSLTIAATVTAAGGAAVPSGNVTFFNADGTALGSPQVSAAGVATLDVPTDGNGLLTLPLGRSAITAQYVDTGTTYASSTNAYTVNIYSQGTTPDFSMQTTPESQTISAANNTTTFSVQFTSLNGFAAIGTPIALSYNTPRGFTCTGAPTAPNFNGGKYATVSVTCGPAAGSSVASLQKPTPHLLWAVEGGAALACMFLFGMPARRRSWQSLIGTMALIVVAFGVTGCGVTVNDGPSKDYYSGLLSDKATPAVTITQGSYNVVMTGTARVFTKSQPNTTITVVHNLPLKIVVQ